MPNSDIHELASFDNLMAAYHAARRGKSRKPDVLDFWFDQEHELSTLRETLLGGTWRPSQYRHFMVRDPKPRRISAVPFRDRVVHHATVRVLQQELEPLFSNRSFACRVGYGTHRAVRVLQRDMQSADYLLKADIRRYFPSIQHAALMSLLRPHVPCLRLRRVIALLLASHHHPDGPPGLGLPLGNQTSQFFGNVYLNAFDHFVQRRLGCSRYVRYVDDFVLMADDKETLHEWRRQIETYLARIGLALHPSKVFVQPVPLGVDFLGYRVFPDHRRLRPSNGYRFRRRTRDRLLDPDVTASEVRNSVAAWMGHAAHADSWGLRRAVLADLGLLASP